MPFAAAYRHHYWSVDVRYIEDHGSATSKPVYVISILENFSRALLASVLSPRQDLTAYLIVLRAAIEAHGAPEVLVSDGGSIFKAKQAQAIYARAGDRASSQIDSGQPWQNYIETHFNVMRRMADHHYAHATTWGELAGRRTTASSRTTTTSRTTPTASGPTGGAVPARCSAGCRARGASRPTSTASSGSARHAASTPAAPSASATGGSTGSAASPASGSPSGSGMRR